MSSWCQDFPQTRAEFPQLEVLASADSTNRVLSEIDATGNSYHVVITSHQTAGRGRLGRQWISRQGESLALSVLVPWVSKEHLSWLSLVVGASLVTSLRGAGVTRAQMKWPNDVLLDGAKLAGILCESLTSGRLVAGIGVNIDFPAGGGPVPGSAALASFTEVTHFFVDSLVCGTLVEMRRWVELEPEKAEEGARFLIDPVLGTLGQQVSVHEMDGVVWTGTAEGLSPEGHLLVETPAGEIREVIASDVRHLR